MKFRLNFAIVLSMLFLAVSCSKNPYSAYLGVWQSSENTPKTFEISKNGDTFLLQDLRDYDSSGKLRAPMVLSAEGEQLVVKTGFGQVALGLTDSNQKLHFDKWTLSKVESSESENMKTSIQTSHLVNEKNRAECAALAKSINEKEREIFGSKDSGSEKKSRFDALKVEKIEKASAIPNCKQQLLIY